MAFLIGLVALKCTIYICIFCIVVMMCVLEHDYVLYCNFVTILVYHICVKKQKVFHG